MEGLGTGLLLFAERSVCNDPLDLVQSSSMLSVTSHCATLPHHSDWSIIGGQAREGDHLMAPSRPLPTLFALLAQPPPQQHIVDLGEARLANNYFLYGRTDRSLNKSLSFKMNV